MLPSRSKSAEAHLSFQSPEDEDVPIDLIRLWICRAALGSASRAVSLETKHLIISIMEETRVKKIEKPYTPFSYRKSAIEAFDKLFQIYRESIIVLSYSSNGFPDREELESGLLPI